MAKTFKAQTPKPKKKVDPNCPTATTCGKCGEAGDGRKMTAAGVPKLPFKWVKVDGVPTCPKCKAVPPARNYTYDTRPPAAASAALLDAQMRLAAGYRNALLAAERLRRQRVDAVVAGLCPELGALEAQLPLLEAELEDRRGEIRRHNSEAGRKTLGTPAQRAAVAATRAALAAGYAARRIMRAMVFADPATAVAPEASEAADREERDRLYNEEYAALYWGTKLHVLASLRDVRRGPPPPPVPFRGDGHVAVQVQGGAAVEAVMDGRCRYVQVASLGDHPRKPHAVLRFRVGSDGRVPVWAELKFRLHRPLPAGGAVKWAHVLRRRGGLRDQWSVVFSVEGGATPNDRARAGRVGVDVGWRRLRGGGLRAAAWHGDDGARGQLVLSPRFVEKHLMISRLASVRRSAFNVAHARLLAWVAEHPLPAAWTTVTDDNPRPPAAALHLWQSEARLRQLVAFWADNRLPGDAELFGEWTGWRAARAAGCPYPDSLAHHQAVRAAAVAGVLSAWRVQDEHLAEFQAGLRRRVANQRKERFRLLSAELRRRYRTVAVEDINWAALLEKLPAECDDEPDTLRAYHRLGAPGTLVAILAEQAAELVRVPPAWTTLDCHACGGRCEFDAGRRLTHACEHCGAEWDQDANAAANILRAAAP